MRVRTWRGLLTAVFEHRGFLPAVTAVGVLLRLGVLFAVRHSQGFPDEREYQGLAITLLQQHRFAVNGWPTAYHAPGEPLFLAGLHAVFQPHLMVAKVVQVLLPAVLPILCQRTARMLGMAVGWANLAALLTAFDPALNYAAITLYPVGLTALALTVGVYYAAVAEQLGKWRAAITAAIAFGCCGLLTTMFAPLPLLAGMCLALRGRVRAGVIVGVVGVLPAVLWVARNRSVMGEWVLSTNGGINLYLGANDSATPRSGNWVEAPFRMGEGEVAMDDAYELRGIGWIEQHPARWSELWICRAALVVDSVGRPITAGVHSGAAARSAGWAMLPLVLLGLAGLVEYRLTLTAWLTLLALALVTVSAATTIVKPRFRLPCDPLLLTFAAGAMAEVNRRMTSAQGAD